MYQYANEEIKAKEQAKAKKVKSLRSKVIGRETYRQCDNMPMPEHETGLLFIINY